MTTRQAAQDRADRIQAFREELRELGQEGVLTLSDADRAKVTAHQDAVIASLAREFDVDVTAGQWQLSLGMRFAAGFGAAALSVSVFLFFYHVWGNLTTAVQVAILTAGPLVGLLAMAATARRERTRYVTGVLGVLTIATFVLDLSALGAIFNLTPTANAFLAWGAFALVLAYTVRLRWLVAISLTTLTVWVGATLVSWSGAPGWTSVFEHWEAFLAPGAAILVVGGQLTDEDFAPAWRFAGWFVLMLSLFVLTVGEDSFLPWNRDTVDFLYQLAGLAVTAGAIAAGVRRGWGETVNLGAVFFAAFLIARLADWWWAWMPNYVFFFIIGVLALGLIAVFRRLRRQMEVGR